MPRPRTVDNATIFTAAATVMRREGPAKLTLARIASEAGLAAPTLVQRFGSKAGLLRAMSKAAKGGSARFAQSLRRRHRSPLARARAFVLSFAGLAPSADALVNNTLVYLQLDLGDPVTRHQLRLAQRGQNAVLAGMVREAVDAGELAGGVEPHDLARVLTHLATGSLLAWALHRTGTGRDFLARDVDAVLAAFRTPSPGRGRSLRSA